MKAAPSVARAVIRVLSPRMLPPPPGRRGSTASTATRWPRPVSWVPNRSMKVDFPDPGDAGESDPVGPSGTGTS